MKNKNEPRLPPDEEVEVSPGFVVQRRTMLAGLAGALAAGAWPFASRADSLSFASFLAEANPLAGRLIDDTSRAGQDRYLRSIAALAANLDDVPLPERFNETNQGIEPTDYRIGFNPGGDPFTVLHWRLEPGAMCRPHAHTYGNVVSVGLEGVVRVENYEVEGEPDYADSGVFVVRKTVDQELGPGDVNLVSLNRNYIHGFVAGPDGARGLDITTRLKPRPDHGTPFLEIDSTPLDRFLNTHEARWIYYD